MWLIKTIVLSVILTVVVNIAIARWRDRDR